MRANLMTSLIGGLTMFALPVTVAAASALDDALAGGGQRLTAEEIAERLTGKTATFVSSANGDKFLVYYGHNNEAASVKIGGTTANSGFHAITDRHQVCIGWDGSDLPRLRCLDIVLIDDVMHKFKADGSLSGQIVELADGNTI